MSPILICIGGAVLDRKYRTLEPPVLGSSNPVSSTSSFGGVARNVAETLGRLGVAVRLLSKVGADSGGRELLEHTAGAGVDISGVSVLEGQRTAEYLAVLTPSGELEIALADMGIFEGLSAGWLEAQSSALEGTGWVFADGNLSAGALERLLALRAQLGFRLALDPVSVAKSARVPRTLGGLDLLFLNTDEARAMTGADTPEAMLDALHARGARQIVLTRGAQGLLSSSAAGRVPLAAPRIEVQDVTGAGDALIAGTLFGLLEGHALEQACTLGQRLAARTVSSAQSVVPHLSRAWLLEG